MKFILTRENGKSDVENLLVRARTVTAAIIQMVPSETYKTEV